eukprot:COSAG02_NODE_54662_length_295_cov_0.448980_1_plen_84_part_01
MTCTHRGGGGGVGVIPRAQHQQGEEEEGGQRVHRGEYGPIRGSGWRRGGAYRYQVLRSQQEQEQEEGGRRTGGSGACAIPGRVC